MLKLGEEQTITTPDGRAWTLGRLELRHVHAFREYVQGQVGDPFFTVDRYVGKFADEHLMPMLREAEQVRNQLRAFSLGCPLAGVYLGTEGGLHFLVSLLLKKHHGDVGEEDAFQVTAAVGRRLSEILAKAMGAVPNAEGPAA